MAGMNDYFYDYNNDRKHQGINCQTPEQKYNEKKAVDQNTPPDVEILKVQTEQEASNDFQHSNILNNNNE
ncbi:MAG: hypothetical protein D4R43_02560 [Sphingobacteriales bacterium]|nr:MAG: hypothetical protein D4R43_02560 [Sphingobacteriales bacterium]